MDAESFDPVPHVPFRCTCDAQVGDHVEVGDERRLLVHRDQARLPRGSGRVDVAFLATDQDPTAIWVHGAGEDLHERGFAGAVGAQQSMHLARSHREGCLTQRNDRSIAFDHAGGVEEQLARLGVGLG